MPLLLSVGYHVKVDIARAVKSRPGTLAAGAARDPIPGWRPCWTSACARPASRTATRWSSPPPAPPTPTPRVSVEELAGQLRALRPNRIVPAYGASAKPSVPDAVAMLREEAAGGAGAGESAGAVDLGGRVVIASYLLAPGFFHDQLAKAGADLVTAPLLPSPVLAEIALERYDAAVAARRS